MYPLTWLSWLVSNPVASWKKTPTESERAGMIGSGFSVRSEVYVCGQSPQDACRYQSAKSQKKSAVPIRDDTRPIKNRPTGPYRDRPARTQNSEPRKKLTSSDQACGKSCHCVRISPRSKAPLENVPAEADTPPPDMAHRADVRDEAGVAKWQTHRT